MSATDVDAAIPAVVQLHRAGRFEDAERGYLEILARRPEHAPALNLLGMLAGQTRRAELSLEYFSRAVKASPSNAEYHNNHANALMMAGRVTDALEAFQQAVQLRPDISEAHRNLGVAFNMAGRRDEAMASFRKALEVQPTNFAASLNLGNLYHAMGRPDEATAQFRDALRLKPDLALAYNNLGLVLASQRNLKEAIECYRRAFTISPDYAQALSNLIYTLHLDHRTMDADLHRELALWNSRYAEPLGKTIVPHGNSCEPGRRLRVGYVSPDFRQHAVGRFIVDVLAAHNRGQVEVHCFSDVPIPDEMTQRIREKADCWHSIAGVPDQQVTELVRKSRIDILVDLTGHTAGSRLRMFARRPAPVQITYLAYCSTTGMKAMDYRLSDPRLDPPAQLAQYYSEETVYLPEAYWCYSAPPEAPEPGPPPARMKGYVTFGCLNSLSKVSDAALETWGAILRAVPNAVLVLHAAEGGHRKALRDIFAAQGADPGRLEFVPYQAPAEYFRTLQRIDIALDPFPFAGGTTTCDALFMGVPVITLRGMRAVGRGGVSILTSLSLLELIASTKEQYIQIAQRLAGDSRALFNYRASLRGMMQKSALMSPHRFTRNLESAFQKMWAAWCQRQGK
ncbi:MAG TPA: tetratricopeptide repeat protein [Phycisphaerae bacterium]|nr:tetratricopeptide repeat protein [Phycisphaerae bacterium]